MKGMRVNQAEITVTPKHPKHLGFVDCEGNELEPGDLIVFGNRYGRNLSAFITRFTPRRVYFIPQYVPPVLARTGNTCSPYEWCTQLCYGHTVDYECFGNDKDRMMHRILKVTEV